MEPTRVCFIQVSFGQGCLYSTAEFLGWTRGADDVAQSDKDRSRRWTQDYNCLSVLCPWPH